jgi:hypothetical protein
MWPETAMAVWGSWSGLHSQQEKSDRPSKKLFNINFARMMRDAGIDAMAALDSGIRDAIDGLPANEQKAIKHAYGNAMASVMVELINPAAAAFPELEPDDAIWAAVVKARATERIAR